MIAENDSKPARQPISQTCTCSMRISVRAVDCHSFMCFGIFTGLREEAANDNRPFRQLIYVKPEEQLDVLVQRLFANEVSSVPCLTTEPDGRPLAPFVDLPISSCLPAYQHLSPCLSALVPLPISTCPPACQLLSLCLSDCSIASSNCSTKLCHVCSDISHISCLHMHVHANTDCMVNIEQHACMQCAVFRCCVGACYHANVHGHRHICPCALMFWPSSVLEWPCFCIRYHALLRYHATSCALLQRHSFLRYVCCMAAWQVVCNLMLMTPCNSTCALQSMPDMHGMSAGPEVCTLLHVATFGSVIACLLRHFRASLASLPLLSQPVGNLPIGTWAPTSRQAQQEEGSMPEVCLAASTMHARPLCMYICHSQVFDGQDGFACKEILEADLPQLLMKPG